uniref:Uncharacterized protein n=1 Tax=Solanum tuberosum TaxID=4113 RepID=M1CEV0_SOLTU
MALLADKDGEIAALQASHRAMDQLHITYRLEHTGLVAKILGSSLTLPTLKLFLKLRGRFILLN